MSHKQDSKELNGAGGAPKAYPDAFERPSRFKNISRYVIFGLVALSLVATGIYIILDWDEPAEEPPKAQTSAVNGDAKSTFAAVDMGLSVQWASQNVGAESPAHYGDYYAWGEVAPRETFRWRESASYDKEYPATLDAERDAATVALGDGWRMPTREEFQELVHKCKWREAERNGVYGFEVVAPNDNAIFLPAAGYRHDTLSYHVGIEGLYWSASSTEEGDNKRASLVRVTNHERLVDDYYRYYGAPIRAVRE
ncbi:MAG: hypothetical protein E7135_00035 [Rikenellaceae bacterium]|nr:hypothetical protein [Rikenellaceae bacterium]